MTLLSKLYQRYRYSSLYEWTSGLRGTPYAKSMSSDRSFFKKFFETHSIRRVFDVGANVGDKALVFSEIAEHVVCVEADPKTAESLNQRFRNRKSVVIRNIAVGSEPGVAKMFRKNFSGFNTLSSKWSEATDALGVTQDGTIDVTVTTLDSLIAEQRRPDYIKIDVEGFELPTIQGLTVPVRALSFEANIPTFFEESREILVRLQAICPTYRFNLRIMDTTEFHLPEFITAETLLDKLSEMSPLTSDVFAVDSAPR